MEEGKSKEERIKEQIELGKAKIKELVKPYPTSVFFTVEAHKDKYNKTGNPLFLMLAFISAYYHNYPIPIWVMEKLNEAFGAYVYGDHPYSLDDLLGCTLDKGQAPARKDYDRSDRNVKLVTQIWICSYGKG